jgi:hypothetical protein
VSWIGCAALGRIHLPWFLDTMRAGSTCGLREDCVGIKEIIVTRPIMQWFLFRPGPAGGPATAGKRGDRSPARREAVMGYVPSGDYFPVTIFPEDIFGNYGRPLFLHHRAKKCLPLRALSCP